MSRPRDREALLKRLRHQRLVGIEALGGPSRCALTGPNHANAPWLAVLSPKAASWTAEARFGIKLGIKLLSATLQRN
jgi:hypothetical protein